MPPFRQSDSLFKIKLKKIMLDHSDEEKIQACEGVEERKNKKYNFRRKTIEKKQEIKVPLPVQEAACDLADLIATYRQEKKESDEEVNEMAFSWNKMLASLKQQLIQPQQPKESEASKEAPKPNIKRRRNSTESTKSSKSYSSSNELEDKKLKKIRLNPHKEISIQGQQKPGKEENKNEKASEEVPATHIPFMNGFSVLPVMNNFMLPSINFGFNLNAMPINVCGPSFIPIMADTIPFTIGNQINMIRNPIIPSFNMVYRQFPFQFM